MTLLTVSALFFPPKSFLKGFIFCIFWRKWFFVFFLHYNVLLSTITLCRCAPDNFFFTHYVCKFLKVKKKISVAYFCQERSWLLQLLQDGLRDTSDHRVFERRYFFKLVTSHISSSLGDLKTVVSSFD